MADVDTLLDDCVTLRYECLDGIFLDGYVAGLQTPEGLARFLRDQPAEAIPRYAILGERTAVFLREVEHLAETVGSTTVTRTTTSAVGATSTNDRNRCVCPMHSAATGTDAAGARDSASAEHEVRAHPVWLG